MNRKNIFFAITACLVLLASNGQVRAAESLKGFLTGNVCVANAKICLMEHKDSKEEHIVFITEDGKTVYELKGVDQKQLREHFTHPVQIEGNVKDNAIEVQSITRIGKSEAGKTVGKSEKHNRPRSRPGGHQGHEH